VLLLLAIPLARLDGASDRRIGLPSGARRWSAFLAAGGLTVLVVASVVSVVVLARAEILAAVHQLAVAQMDRGDLPSALGLAQTVARDDADMPPYLVTHGLAALAAGDWPAAAAALESAARVDDLPQSWLGLALAQTESGAEPGDVAGTLERAMRLGVQQPAVTYAAAVLYDRLGMRPEADEAYATALANVPALAGDPSWTADAVSTHRFAAVLDSAIERAGDRGWEIALMAGDPERALELIGPDRSLGLLRTVVRAWSGDANAAQTIYAQADAMPLDLFRLLWGARTADRHGLPEQARRYRRLMEIAHPGHPGVEDVRVGPPNLRREAVTGAHAINYGTYMYRRPTPFDLLPMGLPHLVPAGAASP
jgi:tetratricopeptide (TPR) repeat protein